MQVSRLLPVEDPDDPQEVAAKVDRLTEEIGNKTGRAAYLARTERCGSEVWATFNIEDAAAVARPPAAAAAAAAAAARLDNILLVKRHGRQS